MAACDGGPAITPAITPGTATHPRPVVIIATDYTFTPAIVDLVPGETVRLEVVNGGLLPHEAVFGDPRVQDAWEVAEAPTASAPPGPTPVVSVDPAVSAAGVRIFVASGQRSDIVWLVPGDAAAAGGWTVACHIPGHLAAGMVVPIRFVGPGGVPLSTPFPFGSVVP